MAERSRSPVRGSPVPAALTWPWCSEAWAPSATAMIGLSGAWAAR